jgi:hypothetical protein
MKEGEPAILQIANADNTPRYFIEGEFLDSVAMAQVSAGGSKYDRPCISRGDHRCRQKKAELRLVPLTTGIFFPASDLSWLLGIQPDAGGIILADG